MDRTRARKVIVAHFRRFVRQCGRNGLCAFDALSVNGPLWEGIFREVYAVAEMPAANTRKWDQLLYDYGGLHIALRCKRRRAHSALRIEKVEQERAA